MANILWIDDYAGRSSKHRIGFDALIFFIEENGHKVEIASTREQAEEAIAHLSDFSLLVLDIIMPPLATSTRTAHQYGGIDVLELIAKSDHQLPIVLLSVMPSRMIKEEALRRGLELEEAGVVEIRRKGSITPTDLAKIVEKYLALADMPADEA